LIDVGLLGSDILKTMKVCLHFIVVLIVASWRGTLLKSFVATHIRSLLLFIVTNRGIVALFTLRLLSLTLLWQLLIHHALTGVIVKKQKIIS